MGSRAFPLESVSFTLLTGGLVSVNAFHTTCTIVVATLVVSACSAPPPVPPVPFSVVEASIPEMQAAMREGRTTSREIVTQYLTRIGLYEDALNAAIAINPNALAEADALDQERAAGKLRGPLHGIPVALKDNILTTDAMPTSGGMLAFKHYQAPYQATLATNLKNAGAIIIAKSTMSELAGWFGDSYRPGGYNAAAGQSYNPYDLRANEDGTPVLETSGSSSGGGVAANLWAGNVGTSTGGSIEGPSNATMLVGIRPSTGRVSRYGIIPLTLDQDTAGPMTKFVADAAIMLGVMEGASDGRDARTAECTAPPGHDYTAFLQADALRGMRIGIPRAGIYDSHTFPGRARPFAGLKPDERASMEEAIAALRQAGADVIDPVELPSIVASEAADNITSHNICEAPFSGPASEDFCSHVLRYGMKRDFNLWLDTLGDTPPVKTLAALREWNNAHRDQSAIRYGQGRLDFADAVDLQRDKARYERDRQDDLRLTRAEGLDAAFTTHKLDALLFPGSSGANYATKAGYPIIVVPFGMVANYADGAKGSPDKTRPYGVSFVGAHCDDPKLVGIAYAFEQTTRRRVPPSRLK
jgi:amidase